MLRTAVLLIVIGMTSSYEKNVLMQGDVILGGLFGIQSFGSAPCNQVDPETVQVYQAVRWFLDILNQRNYTKNMKFGLASFNTCDEPADAVQATLDMLEMFKDRRLYGVLGPGRSSETQDVSRLLSSLPEANRLPQLSYSATATTLGNKDVYANLVRVIVPDNMQIEVLHQLLLKLKWNYIAIVYETDTYGTESARALKTLAEKSQICVPIYFGIPAEESANGRRLTFDTLQKKLEIESQSPVSGLVFLGLGSTAKVMFTYLNLGLESFQVIASEAISLNTEYLEESPGIVFPRAKGLLTLSPPFYDPLMFREYWRNVHTNATTLVESTKDNEWLLRYMEEVTECYNELHDAKLIPPSCLAKAASSDDIHMSIYVSYALTAVATFAKMIKGVYEAKCLSQSGVCSDMINMDKSELIDEMGHTAVDALTDFPELATFTRSFSFSNGEIVYKSAGDRVDVPTYGVHNFQQCGNEFCFEKVGDHINGELIVNISSIQSYDNSGKTLPSSLEAQCESGYDCSNCKFEVEEVVFIPGDFYVVGLAPLHDKGTTPLTCGPLRTSLGVDIAEAIIYSVKRANLKKDKFVSFLGTKSVGVILIDTCNSPLVAKERILKLNKGDLPLSSDVNSSSVVDKIIGYVGPYGSSLSVPISSVMTELDKIFISYASTSSSLSSRTAHPNFMRTCSPDYKQANVIMYLAQQLKSKYVQIIHSDEEYGIAGSLALQEAAKEFEICIAQILAVPDTKEESKFLRYVSELRWYPHAKTVIVFVRSHITGLLMKALNQAIDTDEFIFIGGESWGKRSALLEGNTKTVGSLTIAQELPKNQGFEEYFGDINVQENENQWVQEYLESKADCYYPMSYNKESGRLCTPSMIAEVHDTDSWVPFAINAAYSLMLGFTRSLEAKCFGYQSICNELRTSDLAQSIRDVRLDIYNDGSNIRVFDDNGEGNVGYTISQIVRDGLLLRYKKVGSSVENRVELTEALVKDPQNFESTCKNELECNRCKLQFNVTESGNSDEGDNSAVVGLGVFVAILLSIIIVLVVLGFLWWRRTRIQTQTPTKSNGSVSYQPSSKYPSASGSGQDEYLTAIDVDSQHYSEPIDPYDHANTSQSSTGYVSQGSGGQISRGSRSESQNILGDHVSQRASGYVNPVVLRNSGIRCENEMDSGNDFSPEKSGDGHLSEKGLRTRLTTKNSIVDSVKDAV